MGDPPLEEQGKSPSGVALKVFILSVMFLLWSSGFSHVGVTGQNHTFNDCFDMAVEQIADASCPESGPERKECLSYVLSTTILPCFKHAGNSEAIHVLVSDIGSDLVAGLLQRAIDFSAITGHEVIVHGVSEAEMLQEMEQISSQDLFYSGWILPHIFVPKLTEQGALLDVTMNVTENQGLDWEDVVQYFQDYGATYLDKIMAIPMDGNMMILYYRKDLFAQNNLKLPTTWEQVLEIAERFNGTDMNDDGVDDFGICLDRRAGTEEFWIKSLMAPYLQSEGTSQGMLLDPNGLRPLVNNIAMAWVLELYTQLLRFSPASSRDGGSDVDLNFEYFTSGRCLMTLHSGKIFKKFGGTDFAKKMGLGVLPGSWYVYDRGIKDVSRCTETLCPHGRKDTEGNIVNYAPYSAMGGLVGAVNRLSSKQSREVMLAFLSFVASRAVSFEMVVTTDTLDPYRWSQLQVERWSQRGWDYDCSLQYINVISRMFVSKNVVSEPALPRSLAIGKILEDGVEQFLREPVAAQESMAEMERLINSAISQFGRDNILQAYRRSLHLPYNPVERKSSSSRYSLRVTVMGIVILMAILMLTAMWFLYMSTLRKFSRHGHGNVAAPGAGAETSLVVTDIQDSTAFWETLDADVMDSALHLHNECIRRVLRDNKGYESATEGDSFIMAFHSARDAITFCVEAQLELLKVDWPCEIIESDFSRSVRRDPSKAALKDVCEAIADGDTYENKVNGSGEQKSRATKPPELTNVDTPMDEALGVVWVGNPAFDGSLASDPFSATASTTPQSSTDAESTYEEEDDDERRLSEIVTTVPGTAPGGDDFWGVQTHSPDFELPAQPVPDGILQTEKNGSPTSFYHMHEEQKDPNFTPQGSKFLTMPRFGKTKETQRTEENSYLYRGLRVRMGVHTGVENADDIEINDASGRTMYTGQSMSMAKAVSDTAHGGQVVASESTYKALPLEQLTQMNVLHCGEHLIANDLTSLQLYEFISTQLVERILYTPPVRTLDCLAKGWSDAPTGEVSLAFTFVVGADVLAQWNKKIFKLALQIFEDIGKGLLDEFSGYQVEVADGLFLTSFPDAISAIGWSVKLHEEVSLAKWPTPLLNHELCEEFTVTEMTGEGDLLMRTTRGLRLKTGIARGAAKACPHATTGQMAYRGRVINRAARLAKFAIAGQVLCSSAVWHTAKQHPSLKAWKVHAISMGEHSLKGVNEPIEIFNMFMEHAKDDDNPYAQRSKRQNFLDTKNLFHGDVVDDEGSSEEESSEDSDVF